MFHRVELRPCGSSTGWNFDSGGVPPGGTSTLREFHRVELRLGRSSTGWNFDPDGVPPGGTPTLRESQRLEPPLGRSPNGRSFYRPSPGLSHATPSLLSHVTPAPLHVKCYPPASVCILVSRSRHNTIDDTGVMR